MKLIKCPYCGKSHYEELYSTSTAFGWSRIYKNGKLVSKDPNIHTTNCHCCKCGKNFAISEQYGKTTIKKIKEEINYL